jgi:hypothetical protein
MAGCFGNSIFDRNMEYQLDQYLNSFNDISCTICGDDADNDCIDLDGHNYCRYCYAEHNGTSCSECGDDCEYDKELEPNNQLCNKHYKTK